jgi:hypothetical protein
VLIEALNPDSTVDPSVNGLASLSTTADDDSTYVRPEIVRFVSGVVDTDLTFLLANSLSLICQHPALTDTSDPIEVFPGPPTHVQVLFPGEIPMPGTYRGKRGLPDSTVFSVLDTVIFYASVTDTLYNPIPDAGVRAHFWVAVGDSDTNHLADIPDSVFIDGETDTLSLIPRMAGLETRIVGNLIGSSLADSSYPLYIVPGGPRRLLVIFPGEEILPGDTTTSEWSMPGKQGDAYPLYVGVPTELTIYLVDSLWNPVDDVGAVQGHLIDVFADPEIYGESDGPVYMGGTGVVTLDFTFIQDAFGDAFFLRAVDLEDEYYNSYLNVFPVSLLAGWMGAWASSPEVEVGELDTIWVNILTQNNNPIPGQEVQFSILEGHGTLSHTIAHTSEDGFAFSTYSPDLGSNGEHVSILVRSYIMPFIDSTEVLEEIVTFSVAGVPIRDIFGIYPNPLGVETDRTTFAYDVPNDPTISRIMIEIFDSFGELVWKKEMRPPEAGALLGRRNEVEWNGRNEKGYRVASGVYLVTFRVYGTNRVHRSAKITLGVIW